MHVSGRAALRAMCPHGTARRSDAACSDGTLTRPRVCRCVSDDTLGTTASVERVTLRVRIQPMGFDVLDELSAVLDPSIEQRMPVFDLLPNRSVADAPYRGDELTLEWTPEITQHPTYGFPGEVYGLDAMCVASAKTER